MRSSPRTVVVSMQEVQLIEEARRILLIEHYSWGTLKAYLSWIRRFHRFRGGRDPTQASKEDVTRFLSDLAIKRHVAPSTQNQALSAILFLYRKVYGLELDWLDELVKAKKPAKLPVVLSKREVAAILDQLRGPTWLMASLMYGSGLRLMECARLRVKDIDFERNQIIVRDGKGRKDRVTVLPRKLKAPLAERT